MPNLSDLSILKQWLYAFVVFALALIALISMRRYLWSKLRRLAAATPIVWDNLLIEAIRLPVDFVLVIASFAITAQFAPDEIRGHTGLSYAIKISVIIGGIWILDRVISTFFRSGVLSNAITGSTRVLFLTIIRVIAFSIGLLVILDTVGVSITPLLASLGVGSVAVALALQDTLSNFFSGIYLLVDKPVRIGDFVKVDEGIEGTITQIGWRSSHVRLLSNNTVVVPNSNLASSRVTNFDLPEKEMAVLVQMSVAHSNDLAAVERVVVETGREIMRTVNGGISSFEPFIRYHTFGDWSVSFSVILRGKTFVDQYLIKHEFIKAIHARFKKEGIEFPFPKRVLQMANGENA